VSGRADVERTAATGVRYRYIWDPEHPLAHSDGYVPEHRRVAWDAGLLTEATRHVVVRHRNGDGLDNRVENLWAGTLHEAACEFGSRNQFGQHGCRADVCAVDGCVDAARSGDLCNLHYRRWQTTGDPLGVLRLPNDQSKPFRLYRRDEARPVRPSCSLEGCDRSARSGGMCQGHARRARLYGDPLPVYRATKATARPYRLIEP